MITSVARREDDRLTWSDIEMLPFYGAALILGGLVVQGLPDIGAVTHSAMAKAALIFGLAGVQHWLASDDRAND
uniref:hypothetical protein n=1 Tax=uncultured Caulobacter sp. TaxID=158749 RepID=UPI0025E5614F|nr:hypothetical protein [uncultured Caulobacter sp.]